MVDDAISERAEAPSAAGPPGVRWKTTLLVCLVIVAIATGITLITFSTEPSAEREGATRQTAMLAEVERVERGSFRPVFVATGIVEPEQDIVLEPRVSGEIIDRARDFTPGGVVEKGERLLEVDPADYKNALVQRQGELREAMSDLEVEMGRQKVAEQDYELLDRDLPSEQEALVLRKPQLRAARERVEAARASVDQAELDLERTTIRAPFAAQVLERDANVGSQVSPGDRLARLVGLEAYWVIATLPQSALHWLSFGETAEDASQARVRNRAAWPQGVYRRGRVEELVGALEDDTRLARVVVRIPDPLAREEGAEGEPSLMLGEYLETRLEGEEIDDVVRLDRDYVRDDDTVWVMKEGTLRVRDVDIALRDAEHAFITEGLRDGERVVTSDLSTVREGAELRVKGADDSPDDAEGEPTGEIDAGGAE